jgi:glycosyltransferase involved in cell wall biosynthesis
MPQVFRDCHIVCLPSYREGLPTVLLEAAASGRPLVSCDVEGCREAVAHGKNGLLVPVRDADALAVALRKLIEDPVLRVAFGKSAREIVVAEFSREIVIGQTLALYQEIQ